MLQQRRTGLIELRRDMVTLATACKDGAAAMGRVTAHRVCRAATTPLRADVAGHPYVGDGAKRIADGACSYDAAGNMAYSPRARVTAALVTGGTGRGVITRSTEQRRNGVAKRRRRRRGRKKKKAKRRLASPLTRLRALNRHSSHITLRRKLRRYAHGASTNNMLS